MGIEDIKKQIKKADIFKTLCQESFSETDWKLVYHFYRKELTLGEKTKQVYDQVRKTNRKAYESSTDKYYKSLSFLLKEYSTQAILKGISTFIFKKENGTLNTTTMNYFHGFVKNAHIGKYQEESKKESKPDNKKLIWVPLQGERNTTETAYLAEGFKDDGYYWLWKCQCTALLNHFPASCPVCGAELDWNKIVIDPEKKC